MTPPDDTKAPSPSLPPIFVGGTGRSGTTITGRLLGAQHDYVVLPSEMRFHAEPQGLPGVVRGAVAPADFVTWMLEAWDAGLPRHGDLGPRGLRRVIDRDPLVRALAVFEEAFPEEGVRAARRLIRAIFDAFARREGARGWVEMTPRNVMHAEFLRQLFPHMRLVNVIRDGRDVVASLLALKWKDDAMDALDWWETRMKQAHAATSRIPEEQCMVLRFDQLSVNDRAGTLRSLLEFLSWEEDGAAVEHFFDRQMTPERAHVGRWRTQLDEGDLEKVEAGYDAVLERLAAAGVALP